MCVIGAFHAVQFALKRKDNHRGLFFLFFSYLVEVKHMAKKVASGQLGLPTHQPPSGWTSDSEAESLKDAFESSSKREQTMSYQQKAEVEEPQMNSRIGDNKPVCDLEENILKDAFQSQSKSLVDNLKTGFQDR